MTLAEQIAFAILVRLGFTQPKSHPRWTEVASLAQDKIDDAIEMMKRVAGDDAIPSMRVLLAYEVQSSWWVGLIGWRWGQELASSYFAWKVQRKHRRYEASLAMKERLRRLAPE